MRVRRSECWCCEVRLTEVGVHAQAVAIVMDSFSDVELLCDLLETSRKRNVCVHLVLDHLNLSLFISMWQELKLNSRNFPVSLLTFTAQSYWMCL